jgi:hypothetical protein
VGCDRNCLSRVHRPCGNIGTVFAAYASPLKPRHQPLMIWGGFRLPQWSNVQKLIQAFQHSLDRHGMPLTARRSLARPSRSTLLPFSDATCGLIRRITGRDEFSFRAWGFVWPRENRAEAKSTAKAAGESAIDRAWASPRCLSGTALALFRSQRPNLNLQRATMTYA